MDGLSAAASGIAVVSLAIQLVDSVGEMRRFLRSVSEAPKELQRLIDLLEQLETIFEQIIIVIEKQEQARLATTSIFPNVMRAIRTCESKLAMLEKIVEATKKASSTSRSARTIGSWKLACKKKDIREFESQLHDAVSLLSLTMMASLTYTHSESMGHLLTQVSATHQATSTITQELSLFRVGMTSDQRYNCTDKCEVQQEQPQCHPSRKRASLKENLTTFREYSSPFGRLCIRNTSQTASFGDEQDQKDSCTFNVDKHESSWVLIPTFLSTGIEFRYLNTCGIVQRSLRTYCVIPESHPVWEMCMWGNLQGIQKLLSERQISPFTVNKQGQTLLHVAAGSHKPNICELLFEMGLTGDEVDRLGCRPSAPGELLFVNSNQELQNFIQTYRIFTSRVDGLDPASFMHGTWWFIDIDISPRVFDEITNEFVSKDNIFSFRNSPICLALKRVLRSLPTDHDHDHDLWRQVTARLIGMSISAPDKRLLEEILTVVDCPFESSYLGDIFLDILSECKVDVAMYLQHEYRRRMDPLTLLSMLGDYHWWDTDDITRPRYLVISERPLSISWDWYIDPNGSAFHVLNEFKYMAYHRSPSYHSGSEWWPFFFSDSHVLAYCLKWGYPLQPDELSRLRIYNDRFQRRQDRKEMKVARLQGIRRQRSKMPGAWID